tara:strand:- start:89 stop:469 length:381 start_codon:yes stop_codon:yes gene_type:complete
MVLSPFFLGYKFAVLNLHNNRHMLFKKKPKEDTVINALIKKNIQTCILKIELIGLSKIEDHFKYEVYYLDNKEIKKVPIISTSVLGVVDIISPYLYKGANQQKILFDAGSENIILSRMENRLKRQN